jgi:Leucine-rich repeat (LRR) protein
MMKKTTFLKVAAALAGSLLLFACEKPPKEITLSVSDKSVSFETAGGEKTVTVTCNDAWAVNSTADWLTISPKAGTDNGSFKITATANNSFEVRSADITVTAGDKSQAIKVNQLSKTPSLLIDPTATEISHEGGEIELKITSNAPWDIHCPVDGNAAIWATPDKENGEGSATVKITVQPNLEREARSITLVVTEKIGNSHQDLVITQGAAPQSRRSDSLALVAIYNLADGAHWKDSRMWKLDTPIDTWPGIKLNKEGRVIEMSITNGTVSTVEWEIPEVLTELSELSTLQIVGSKLKGEIPEFLYGMTKLAKIRFNTNNLTGALSDKISQWTELTELYLNGNKQLGGSIPATIGQLKKLESINIAQTAISGTIPAELAGCTALKNFMAYETSMSGPIPEIWDQFPDISVIQLYGTPGFECPLPVSFGNINTTAKTLSLQLKNCNFTGNIPESYANLPAVCKQLFVNGNKLSGVIPAAVQAHANWDTWKPATNILPQQDGYVLRLEPDYRQLDSLALVKIYTIADGANWKESRRWKLDEPMDNWPGIKLNTEGRVIEMSITNGTVTTVEWEIPEALTELTELSTLQIVGSKLKGEIPEFLYDMTSLAKVRFNTNNLTGGLSDKIRQLTNLTELYLNGNKQFAGTIPATIGQLKKLESINIAQTAISGSIPAELAGCVALKNFMAYETALSGTIPEIWDQFPDIMVIQLYGNPGFECPLPVSFGSIKTSGKSLSLQLKNCNFTGNIPENYANLPSVCNQLFVNGNKLSGVIPAAVQAHANWTKWKAETNILPQQEGFGLTLE